MMSHMTRLIRRIFGFEPRLDDKVQDALEFTVRKYGKTLKDLARYDRGEPISDTREILSR